MIKLIAADLDGTLLQNGNKDISSDMIRLIRELKKMGILFAAASGRQYRNLLRLFAPVQEDIAYICENGTLVVYQGEILFRSYIEKEVGRKILSAIRDREGCEILLSGMNTSYLQPKEEAYEEHMKFTVKNDVTVVKDILSVEEPYLKISVYERDGIEHSERYFKEQFGEALTVVTSGYAWLDMIPKGISKGSAMEVLQKHFKIKPEECMAFGDHYNDVEMLQNAGYGYAVENAQKEVYDMCRYHTSRVETVLEDIVKGVWK